jgi:hypothetical protein
MFEVTSFKFKAQISYSPEDLVLQTVHHNVSGAVLSNVKSFSFLKDLTFLCDKRAIYSSTTFSKNV